MQLMQTLNICCVPSPVLALRDPKVNRTTVLAFIDLTEQSQQLQGPKEELEGCSEN